MSGAVLGGGRILDSWNLNLGSGFALDLRDLLCNLCGHLQRCEVSDIEESRKAAEKGAEWVTGRVPVKQPKTSEKCRNPQIGVGLLGIRHLRSVPKVSSTISTEDSLCSSAHLLNGTIKGMTETIARPFFGLCPLEPCFLTMEALGLACEFRESILHVCLVSCFSECLFHRTFGARMSASVVEPRLANLR